MASYLNKTHTILLVSESRSSSSYQMFNKTTTALERVIKLYEQKLKEMNPQASNITYDISNLNEFIDSLYDITLMVLDERAGLYEGLSKADVKKCILAFLKNQA
uniref:Enhancer of rudimentary homolog n=1 Tax=Florenciella parvula TaxID=236787 RepID=A0A7S2C6V8_9STRA|eukprot:CAMPEP_0119480472 /NCGR_PEP_ID=MMETSP1344-20130328/9266_1 /TAXON_ID=236787 /ORGANISM="Florenciella parvula, Strain CCMP2471" /LENGTH=103 /DNA_ID=CAMNT_0007514783 /DNA_START=79 /DNA_END=390 /DNA_ORIENTATION=-